MSKGKGTGLYFLRGDKNSYPTHQKPHRDSSDSYANHTICCGRTKDQFPVLRREFKHGYNLWSPVQPLPTLVIWFSTTFFRVWACFQSIHESKIKLKALALMHRHWTQFHTLHLISGVNYICWRMRNPNTELHAW